MFVHDVEIDFNLGGDFGAIDEVDVEADDEKGSAVAEVRDVLSHALKFFTILLRSFIIRAQSSVAVPIFLPLNILFLEEYRFTRKHSSGDLQE